MKFSKFYAAREREVPNLLQPGRKLYPFEVLASGKCPVVYDCHAVAEYQCPYALTTSEGDPSYDTHRLRNHRNRYFRAIPESPLSYRDEASV